ncbi:MAG: 4-hydroxythreonine-4-phosphate dehydrogenase PdxA [Burkholderiaceae bacterium]|jgi:4-hydroxythreonine-4-phosphate dehydrogenase|nr:4-hydroxythreonine-4-phosphate dehydrogenase PdxA [Burkholderiaceae bacterium]
MTALPIAITLGDPAGIGPEIIAKAFRDAPDQTRGCFVVGDVAALRRACAAVQGDTGVSLPVAEIEQPDDAWQTPPRCVPVLQVLARVDLPPIGRVSAQAGRMAGDCVVWAARAALRGQIAALVTAPLHKQALAAAGPPYDAFAGHTELLQAECAAFLNRPMRDVPVRMMLANDELRVVLLSIHLPLAAAIAQVTEDNIVQTLRIAHQSLATALNRVPRIAVAGLNPHAGEGGLLGREEIDIIAPAIARARAEGINAQGPFAPDTIFMRARRGEFDVVAAMYHDQGLIPVKYLGVERGVNVTLGLPLVRTSPDHGTAFDIAGSGQADPASLLAAIGMAQVR